MNVSGKIVVVTGGTSGIGRATALRLAEQGADVVAIGRDPVRGAETEAALKRASDGFGVFLQADLSLISEARRVVKELTDRLPRIHALIQSAGVIEFDRATTAEGHNRMFVINFLHKVVLAEGLAPLLAKGPGRMVLVAADIPDRLQIDWANFEGERSYAGVVAMSNLHGAGLALAQKLAAEWKDRGIEVTAIHPGQVDTGIYRSFAGGWRLGKAFMRFFLVPPERPAALLMWLAFSPDAKGLSGSFFPSPKNFAKRRILSRDAATLERVSATAHAILSIS